MIQAKEDFIFVFPKGMCGEITIKVHVNPFSIKEVVTQIMTSQGLVFGNLCIVQDMFDTIFMTAFYTDTKGIKFLTEDDEVKQIKETEDK